MVVQHNLRAMNSNRMLGITAKQQAKSSEKLSSGYKINRAADDAAGLSISEKMRKQIRGLTQASLNAQDGISAVQTAEGALTEVHDMLQRANELAVKAANGTMSADDRQAVQDEIDQLVTEIDRVSETTKFNETYLLKGDPASVKTTVTASYANEITETVALKNAATAPTWYLKGETTAIAAGDITKYLELDKDGNVVAKEGIELYTAPADDATNFGDQLKATIVKDTDIQNLYEKSTNALRKDTATGAFATEEDLKNYFNEDGTYKGGLWANDGGTYKEVGADHINKFITLASSSASTQALTMSFQVGAETDLSNKINVSIESMSAKAIGVDGLKVTGDNSTNADAAVNTISDAIGKVSKQRSALGAIQNRLDHTINNLDNVVENTTAAESQIRDTDMATEMVKYSNNNILAQAGQAMLAQSNQANQGVLSLLQ